MEGIRAMGELNREREEVIDRGCMGGGGKPANMYTVN
jgi:hypothetical protein